jgi:nucleoside-diphosphate-sugar epimerase
MEEFMKDNVEATRTVIKAAKEAKVKRFVHCSTEAVLIGGPTLVNADETWPYPQKPLGHYSITKGLAEKVVLEENNPKEGFEAVIVRPRMVSIVR